MKEEGKGKGRGDLPELIDFEAVGGEPWVEYRLSDGVVLKVRHSITTIFRNPSHDPMGLPIYSIKGQLTVRLAKVPDRLRKKPRLDKKVTGSQYA